MYLPPPASVKPEDPIQHYTIRFQKISDPWLPQPGPVVYRCLDCAAVNVETIIIVYDSDTSEMARHVNVHSQMARWYEARILNRKE